MIRTRERMSGPAPGESSMKLNVWKIMVIGLAFFTVSLAWTIYNTSIPVFLGSLVKSQMLIGVIMTFDNIFGIIFQPLFGRLSDKTTRFGRRLPYVVVGIPLAAVFFAIVPFYDKIAAAVNWPAGALIFLMTAVIGMNFAMSIYRAPAVALMPDMTPPALRSKANGIINAMGGLGTIVAMLAGGYLFSMGKTLPFIFGSVMMIGALVVLLLSYREPAQPYEGEPDEGHIRKKGLLKNKPAFFYDKSLLNMLLAVFFWFCGAECITAFFTLFCTQRFGVDQGQAMRILAPLGAAYLIAAIPGGWLGAKIGRKKSMLIGNVMVVAGFLSAAFAPTVQWLMPILFFAGVGWSIINACSYPVVAQLAPKGQTGRYTGYYYAFSFAASIASPIVYGLVADIAGGSHAFLFVYGGIMFLAAMLLLSRVKHTEALPETVAAD